MTTGDQAEVAAGNINFVRNSSENYVQVEKMLLKSIQRHLPEGSFSETRRRKDPSSLNFSLFVQLRADVLMSHGAADKSYFFRRTEDGRFYANEMTYAFVPGKWLKHRLVTTKKLAFTEDRVFTVGWPRLDRLLKLQAAHDADPDRRPHKRPKVLWAPTHDFNRRGEDLVTSSSYPELLEHMPELEKHFDVVTSLHPRNRDDKTPTKDQLIDCDYVISDIGTMVYEAWTLGKPVIFPHWIIGDRIQTYARRSAEAHLFRERIGIHANSVSDIIDAVMGGATIDDRVRTFLDDYMDPRYKGKSGRRIARLLQKLAARDGSALASAEAAETASDAEAV